MADYTNSDYIEGQTPGGITSVITDSTTILGSGTISDPLRSGLSTLQTETITGAKNGSNQTFALSFAPNPANLSNLVWNGATQLYGKDYTVSGTALTLLTFAPTSSDDFWMAAPQAPVAVASPFASTYSVQTFSQALAMATGSTPFLVIVRTSSQNSNLPTLYMYDGSTTGYLTWIAGILVNS